MPRLFGMMTVRNEGDVVGEALKRAAAFHERIYVVDCGSTDDSIEVVKRCATDCPNIRYLGTVGPHHSRQVKRHIWVRFRREIGWGSWWSVVDADEFLHEDPAPVISQAEGELADHIFAIFANFYLTKAEAAAWHGGSEGLADRSRSIAERRRLYRMHTTQIRMFRNLPWHWWNSDVHHPKFLAKPCTRRLVYRHYQYRDPVQIQQRIDTRREWVGDRAVITDNPHWDRVRAQQAFHDDNDPSLRLYQPGGALVPDPLVADHQLGQTLRRSVAKYAYAVLRYGYGALFQPSSDQFWERALL